MQKLQKAFFSASLAERILIFLASGLSILALFYNLGLMPLHGDEGIRATVAFEMLDNDNFVVPTLANEYYYRKPPFYNWLIAGTFNLFDSYSEFVFRLPSVIPLMLYALSIWLCARIYLGNRVGILSGFLFLFSGTLLTRDSMLGHIDVFFSWITFLSFFFIFHFYVKRKFYSLFLISYILAAIGVLCKGLPSFLFQSFTLLAWFIYKKEFKQLLRIPHFLGIGVFSIIVVGYFFIYSKYNELVPYFEALIDQSSQRTFAEKPWYEGLLNILTFPLENLFVHMMPTALIFLFVIQKGILRKWMRNDFTAFLLLTFAINIIPYWLSPGYYPRYLYMLYPLLYILGALAYWQNRERQSWQNSVFEIIVLIAGIMICIASIIPLFSKEKFMVENELILNHILLKTLFLFACWLLSFYVFFKWRKLRIYSFIIFIALFRIAFDFYILPHRAFVKPNASTKQKTHSKAIVEKIENSEIYLYKTTRIKEAYYFYLGSLKGSTLEHKTENFNTDDFYIMSPGYRSKSDVEIIYEFEQNWSDRPELYLVRLKN